MGLFCEERMIHHDPSQLNDASYGWQTTPELEHLRAGAVLWQPNVSCKYSAICAICNQMITNRWSRSVMADTQVTVRLQAEDIVSGGGLAGGPCPAVSAGIADREPGRCAL